MKILLAIDGSRYSRAATRFLCAYEMFSVPYLQPITLGVADAPESAVLEQKSVAQIPGDTMPPA